MANEYYRFYREDTGQTVGITSLFNEIWVEVFCTSINQCKLKAGKMAYEPSNSLEYKKFIEGKLKRIKSEESNLNI